MAVGKSRARNRRFQRPMSALVCLEDVPSYLYANGRDGEYSDKAFLLSKTVHSFTHETQVKRKAKEGDEVQATLRDMLAV